MPIPILPQKAHFHICCNSCCSFFYWSWKLSRQDMISTLKWREALCEYIKVLPKIFSKWRNSLIDIKSAKKFSGFCTTNHFQWDIDKSLI